MKQSRSIANHLGANVVQTDLSLITHFPFWDWGMCVPGFMVLCTHKKEDKQLGVE